MKKFCTESVEWKAKPRLMQREIIRLPWDTLAR